ncbi:site-specific DNA-methyltransferase [uncultured Chitinophaga sp.]|uniref:site-specific DNA-methyltransferase n=1 Tax=uncultured Chitinophaga sp. TaxID=339340 RepID=UPI0025E02E5C|nr:site-specific DNA-methyltransferase [uncultured Chitinophaga sp.]
MAKQESLGLKVEQKVESIEEYKFEPIKGYPMLHWKGKRPFTSTQYYPAQLKEQHGQELDGWINKIFWGDNLQVMSHLLKMYRGQVDLIYIDPPFDSKADYKKNITLKGKNISNDHSTFEEKQYTDIWSNDDYLQFMYERIILLRELLSEKGSLFLHCDWHKSHLLRMILEEVFGASNFVNEIIWKRKSATSYAGKQLGIANDTIFWMVKSNNYTYNPIYSLDDETTKKYIKERYTLKTPAGRVYKLDNLGNPEYRPNLIYEYKGCKPPPNGWAVSLERMKKMDAEERLEFPKKEGGRLQRRQYLDEYRGQIIQNIWADIFQVNSQAKERTDYPTQKPETLLERIIKISSNPGDLVLDCFMGSGTTQVSALKMGRRFLGADINLASIQTTSKRLINTSKDINEKAPEIMFESENSEGEGLMKVDKFYTGFQVYNVNHYDVFRNPLQAKELLIKALEIQPLPNNALYDGEKDGRMVKIMPINRIATRADLNELITGFDYKVFEKRNEVSPGKAVEHLQLVCMGHEPDLAAILQKQMPYKLDIEVVDILRDKSNLEFKRDSEADFKIKDGDLIIEQFYPMNLLQKLSLMKENVEDWKELTESVMIDFNYDGAIFEPQEVDVPPKDEVVKGVYKIPENAGTIRVKITDLLSESLEIDVNI